MPVKRIIKFLLLIIVPLSLASCLTCEKKEYTFTLTNESSGTLTIRYINIFSSDVNNDSVLIKDYDELVEMWYKGEKIERDFPQAKNYRKRLYEENGQLCAEITMDFDDLAAARLYRFNGSGPFLFNMSSVNDDGENFYRTNGEYGGEKMNVVFWPEDKKTLRLITKIGDGADHTCVSMLDVWNTRF